MSNHNSGSGNGAKFGKEKDKHGLICKLYQIGSFSHARDHTSGGKRYKHICNLCHGSHPAKDCKNHKDKVPKND